MGGDYAYMGVVDLALVVACFGDDPAVMLAGGSS